MRLIRAIAELNAEGRPRIETVALYTDADATATFVRQADLTYYLGPAAARPYLDLAVLERALAETGADAAWVGWGFVAEDPAFAELCEKIGVTFIGPDAEAMRKLGDKIGAKLIAEEVGVPLAPWSRGPVENLDAALRAAERIGYPLMLKAAAGGGGRGIRIAHDEAELRKVYTAAAREAGGAFGDDRLYVERFIERARHIEVQVLGDGAEVIHFGERECSLQRRRQKVVEESPAPGLGAATREGLCAAALALREAIGYRSAGTVEFLVDDATGDHFFIEMNTRIQVEHPVTELVTGVDLVAEQLRIAGGEPLRLTQDDIAARGCAIELRLNAEDPANDFLPSPGTATTVRLPSGPWVRVDGWLAAGGEVPPFYDSLLAKIIVWGDDRETALARARRALAELEVDGISTTAPLLTDLLRADWFAAGDFHTATLEAWL